MTAGISERQISAEIISIGTELLLGEITDTNASWLASRLPALGVPLFRIQQVGDNQRRLVNTLSAAWERANVLILTGGLGPTEDDLTRESIAELLGEQMTIVPDLERDLRAFFDRRGRTMPERNVKQATIIPSASVLKNPIGTAPGWWVSSHGKHIATMPGVPTEMRRMWEHQVVPRLVALPRGGAIVTRTLKILGLGESAVEEQLGALVRGMNPTIATYAKSDGIHVRIAVQATDTNRASTIIDDTERQVRDIFGERVYGVDADSLSDAMARMLETRGLSIAVGEAGSAGAICTELSGPAFAGGIVKPALDAGLDGDSTRVVAVELARTSRMSTNADIGLSVAISHQADARVILACAVTIGDTFTVRIEDQSVDASEVGRRSVLVALQLLREKLLDLQGIS